MKFCRLNYHLLFVCVNLYIASCSMEKTKGEKKHSIDQKQVKETLETKEPLKAKETKIDVNNRKQYHRKTFERKEDIPQDYLDMLKKRYNIVEDPAAEYDKKQQYLKEFGNYDYDFYNYDEDLSWYDSNTDSGYYDSYEDSPTENKDPKSLSNETKSNATDSDDTTSNTTCKMCEALEKDKQLRLDSIKTMILSKIGFSSQNLPNMTGKTIPRIPSIQRLIEQHEMQADAPSSYMDEFLPEDEFYGQVKKAYTIAQMPPEDVKIHVEGGCYFDLPESVRTRRVADASLWIYIEPSAMKRKEIIGVYVYIIPEKAKPEHLLKGPVRYKKITTTGWIEFKFSHIVHHWINQPNANRGVVIQALDEEGKNLAVTPGNGHNENFIPMLEMTTMGHRHEHRRGKRSINNICTGQERQESCCRYPLRVDFVQFGWDWVIAPTGYMANFCSGECRYRHMENNPQAYIIQQTPDENGPCCTPSKYFPLAMLYFDHAHTVLYTHMQKMIVTRCGCA